jgi:hypothetical protein
MRYDAARVVATVLARLIELEEINASTRTAERPTNAACVGRWIDQLRGDVLRCVTSTAYLGNDYRTVERDIGVLRQIREHLVKLGQRKAIEMIDRRIGRLETTASVFREFADG